MNVLLINPPLKTTLPVDGAYPMGLGYVAAMLRQAGCNVDVLDIRLNKYDENYVDHFLKNCQGKYGLFGIGGMVTSYRYAKWISQEIKKYNPLSLIMAGGSLCTAGELILRNSNIDIVCIGEGEKPVVDIVDAMRSNSDFSEIRNIILKKGDTVVQTEREQPQDINSIPFPAWDLFDMQQYTSNSYLVSMNKPSITMITERGCPFECSFCYRNFGRKVRKRSIDKIIEEIKTVIDRYGIGHIDFLDEIFNVSPTHVKELCKSIMEEGIRISWRCIGRADLVNREILSLMYNAGCRWIGYGIESGSQEMLNRMNKKQKIENIEESIRLARSEGLIVTGTFIVGMPGESEQTIQESREFFQRNRIFNIPFFPVPYPGAVLYDEIKNQGHIEDEEHYVLSLERDATELIINLTDMPDARLNEIKKELVENYCQYIPSMELQSGTYTVYADSKVDEVVEKHLAHIIAKLKEIPSVRSIILGGGFGRGEGSVLIDHKGIRPVNDYDLFVIVSDDDKTDYTSLSNVIAGEIGMRLIDIIPVMYSSLSVLPLTQFYYDLKYGSRHLWGEYVIDLIPVYKEGNIDYEAGRTVLMNRLICAIEAYSERFEDRTFTQEEGFFLINQTGKVISSCVEALLMKKCKYNSSYRKRQALFEKEFPEKITLIELNRIATDFKLRPVESSNIDPVDYWKEAVHEYVNVIAEYTLCDSRPPVEAILKLLKESDPRLSENPVEHLELMLLLCKETSIAEKSIILSEMRSRLKVLGESLPDASWEEIREKTASLWHDIHSGKSRKEIVSQKNVVLLILVDGFRHDYMNPDDSPFLYSLAKHNIDGIVRETFAFELRPAFFAGLQPDQCDVANMFSYNPDDSIFRSIDVSHGDRNRILDDLRNEAADRNYSLVKHVGNPCEIPVELLKYFDFSEKYHTADPFAIEGHKTLFDYLRNEEKKWLWVGYPDGPGTTVEVLNNFQEGLTHDLDFIYLHFSELDWAGHEAGPHSEKQRRILREIDQAIEEVYRTLNGTFKNVRSIVFGDHGQVAIKKHIDIESKLKQTGLRLEEDYIYFLDSTQVRFWFFNDRARNMVTALLKGIPEGTVLTADDYERLHFFFEDNKFGEVIFVVNDGVGIFPNYFQSANPCKGLHGYLPEVEGNWAKLIVTGLGIEKCLDHPLEMVSIFPTLLELLDCEKSPDLEVKSILEITEVQKVPSLYRASIVMPTYNRLPILKKCIHAIEQQTCLPGDFELIIVDDGSTDGTGDFIEDYGKSSKLNIRYFRQENSGPASARNTGIKNSWGDVIILLGDDMIMQSDFVDNHLHFHDEWPQIGHGCLGLIEWSKDIEQDFLMTFITSKAGGQQFNYHYIESQDPDNIKWDGFWSSNISFKKHFALTHGLFNGKVFKRAMWEDIDLGYRLGKAGLKLHYRKECLVSHDHKINLEEFIERQRMVGWYNRDLRKLNIPEEYLTNGAEDRIYSRNTLSFIMKLLSELESDTYRNDTDILNRIYNYTFKYASLVGHMEREGKMRDDIEGGVSLLMNLSTAELELTTAELELTNNEERIKDKDGLIAGYKKKNKKLSTFVGKLDGLVPSLEKLLKRTYDESSSPEMLVEAGEVCFSLGIYENAKYFFNKALNIEPGSSDALNNLGVLSSRNRDYDMARDYFMRSLDHNPENEEAKVNLATMSVIHEQ